MDAKYYETLNINEKTMQSGDARSVSNNKLVANFVPPIPTVEQCFTAERFTYKALEAAEAFIVSGKNSDPDYLVQVTLNIPKSTEDGTHPIVDMYMGVSMSVLAGGQILHATGGKTTFERDNQLETISARFNSSVHFTYDGQVTEHQVTGEAFLNATDPL